MQNQHEGGPENIPTKEEVLKVIYNLISKVAGAGVETKEAVEVPITNEQSDDMGPFFLEVTVVNENGEKCEYAYTRDGNFPNGITRIGTGIDVVYYNSSNIPCGGTNVAEFKDGVWMEI